MLDTTAMRGNAYGYPSQQRAKSWTFFDKLMVVVLCVVACIALGADVAVVYIYLTSKNILPGLVDNPEYAYLWSSVPIFMALLFGMLPYFGSRNKKVRLRLVYGGLAVVLFLFTWVPSFVGLFQGGIGGDTKEIVARLWQNKISVEDNSTYILKWMFMGGQILCLVLASASSALSIFIMVEDRRVERLVRNPRYDGLLKTRADIEAVLALANHKKANHDAILKAIGARAKSYAEAAVGFFRAVKGRD